MRPTLALFALVALPVASSLTAPRIAAAADPINTATTPAGTTVGASASTSADAPAIAPVASTPETLLAAPPAESPPPLPHKKGLVLDTSLGGIGFLGQLRHVAPTAVWLHTQLGYELTNWLMLFGEGEMFFTDTSVAVDATKTAAFAVFGFGAGGRFTIHATERVAFFGQLSIDAMKADVPKNTLKILGYPDAESINPSFGARLGVEWYQIDRHFALGLATGIRDATGFAKLAQKSDSPLMWDGGVSIRYTF